jgi:hypothetical protein
MCPTKLYKQAVYARLAAHDAYSPLKMTWSLHLTRFRDHFAASTATSGYSKQTAVRSPAGTTNSPATQPLARAWAPAGHAESHIAPLCLRRRAAIRPNHCLRGIMTDRQRHIGAPIRRAP